MSLLMIRHERAEKLVHRYIQVKRDLGKVNSIRTLKHNSGMVLSKDEN